MGKSKKRIKNGECTEVIYKGIYNWYQDVFERFGWMVLAKEKGMIYKIDFYKTNLQKLKCTIVKKHDSMNDIDKKKDLEIMLTNVNMLIKHANKL